MLHVLEASYTLYFQFCSFCFFVSAAADDDDNNSNNILVLKFVCWVVKKL
jgi:hypothetical protein